METTNKSTDKNLLSMKEKIVYSLGSVPSAFYISFIQQIQTFYYVWMGLNVRYIFIAQIFYAIWNVINDPIFGILQDRTRTKYGRYIPWIRVFGPILALSFILVFMVPQQWRFQYGGYDTEFYVFLWYLFSLIFYDLGFTIVVLAHVALLPQISHDFSERTQISLISTIAGVIGTVASIGFPLIFLTNPTASKIVWFQICVIIFGVISIIPWFLIVKYVHEKKELIPENKESFWTNIKYVFKNPACKVYIIYDGITVGINGTFSISITLVLAWILGLENPYSGSNPVEFLDLIPYFIFPVVCFVMGFYFQMYIPKKKDLKTLLLWDYVFMAIGFILCYIGSIPSDFQSDIEYMVPPNIWLVSIGLGFVFFGFMGNIIYLNPLNADVVDYDEVLTGERRESVYSGVNCVFSKPMSSVVAVIFPFLLSIYGLLPASPDDPTSEALVVTMGMRHAILGVGVASFLFPAILSIIGFFCFLKYPLDRKKLEEIRKILNEKHKKQKEKFEN